MSTDLVTIAPSTPLSEAKALFEKHNIHHLPVTNPEGELVGMLSHSDFVKLTNGLAVSTGEIMTTKLAKLENDDTVRTAANLFLINRFHALPVVDGKKLIGIITVHDLVRLMDTEAVSLKDYQN
jgi:CBS domain-containing protein